MRRAAVRHHRRGAARSVARTTNKQAALKLHDVLLSIAMSQVATARRLAELTPGVDGRRATWTRIGYGVGASRAWPKKHEVSAARKALLDDPEHAPHSLLTEFAGKINVWKHVSGSAVVGARQYQDVSSSVRRLRMPWSSTVVRDPGGHEAPSDIPDLSLDQFMDDVAPSAADAGRSAGSTSGGPSSDSVHLSSLQAHTISMLKTLEGGDPVEVAALLLDAAYSLQLSLERGRKKDLTTHEVLSAPDSKLTLGADCGPMRGRSVLAVTVALSSSVFRAERTNLVGLAYVFGSENSVSAAVYLYIAEFFRQVMNATLNVEARPLTEAGSIDGTSSKIVKDALPIHEVLQVFCTFS